MTDLNVNQVIVETPWGPFELTMNAEVSGSYRENSATVKFEGSAHKTDRDAPLVINRKEYDGWRRYDVSEHGVYGGAYNQPLSDSARTKLAEYLCPAYKALLADQTVKEYAVLAWAKGEISRKESEVERAQESLRHRRAEVMDWAEQVRKKF